jgi:hypothetical protein
LLHLGRLLTYPQMLEMATHDFVMEGSCSTQIGGRLLLRSGRLLSYIRPKTFVRDTLALLTYAPDIRTNVRQSYRRFCHGRLLLHSGRLLSYIRLQTFVMDTLVPLGFAPDKC